MISPELQVAIDLAQHEALNRRHSIVTLEHLLYALLHDPETMEVLRHSGAEVSVLKAELDAYLSDNMEVTPDDEFLEITASLGFQRALRRAVLHVQGSRMDAVKGFNVLVAIFAEADSFAKYFLERNDVTRLDIVQYVSHGVSKIGDDDGTHGFEVAPDNRSLPETTSGDGAAGQKKDPLRAFCTNLNEEAEEGRIDPLIGREKEVHRLVQVLSRRRKNNPVLVGDSGVGKTAIVEGLARKIFEDDVAEPMKGVTVWSLDMGSMLAGTKYRGDFEERMKAVVKALQKEDNAVLFIDEIHTMVGAGATEGGTMDASNLLKPALSSGKLRCIGSTTYKEFRNHFEKDRALARRFQRIEVEEPSVEDTIKILQGLKPRYEEFHAVTYSAEAIETAAHL